MNQDNRDIVIQLRLDRTVVRRALTFGVVAAVVAIPTYLLASVSWPTGFPFQAGTPISASEVNNAFYALQTASDANEATIGTNASAISTNAGHIGDLQAVTGSAAQVRNTSGTNVHVEACKVDNWYPDFPLSMNGASGLCENWLAGGARLNTGTIRLDPYLTVFSAEPICTATSMHPSIMATHVTYNSSTGAIIVETYNTSGALQDGPFSITCVGKR